MRNTVVTLFVLFASVSIANAANQGNAVDLRSTWDGQMRPFAAATAASAGVCDPETLGLITHDDGQGENGYGFNTGVATEGRMVDKFTPPAYPATVSTVCISFITNNSVSEMDFEILFYDDTGPGGTPGNLIAAKIAVAHPKAVAVMPFTPAFEAFDVSDLGFSIASGVVYIGARWYPSEVNNRVFMASDETPATPLAGGQFWANEDPWEEMANMHPNYRSLMVRAVIDAPIFCNGFEMGEDGTCN